MDVNFDVNEAFYVSRALEGRGPSFRATPKRRQPYRALWRLDETRAWR